MILQTQNRMLNDFTTQNRMLNDFTGTKQNVK